MAGMIVGTVVAVGLTLVSPNVTYPKAVREASMKVLDGEAAKRAKIEAKLASADPMVVSQAKIDQKILDKAVTKAKDDMAKVEGKTTSLLGLEEPMFKLKNPGIISIPLGFLAVLLGSLLFRDKRSEELWPEVYARQNTGILASKATSH
jgi:cation/acetate symporter